MTPQHFKESNKNLVRPIDMTEKECGSLSIYTDGNVCISQWKMTFKERIHCFFHGFIWVRIHSGSTQPPIALDAEKSIFE